MTSKRIIMIFPATAMLVCLGAYAISAGGAAPQSTSVQPAAPAPTGQRTAVPMRAITQGELQSGAAQQAADKQQDFNESLRRKDAEIIAQLGLSDEQMTKFNALKARLDEETEIMRALPSGHVQRGLEINQMLHKGLKEIFTPEQYQKYLDLWGKSGQKAKPVAKKTKAVKVDDPMATGTPFGGTDEAVLNEIRPKLTSKQWKQYREFRVDMDARNQEMYRLLREGDTMAAGFMSGDINKANLDGMRAILSEDQYQQWIDTWNEVMAPFINNGGNGEARRELIAAPAEVGEPLPVAEKVGEGAGAAQPQN